MLITSCLSFSRSLVSFLCDFVAVTCASLFECTDGSCLLSLSSLFLVRLLPACLPLSFQIKTCEDAYSAADGAHALAILTEWYVALLERCWCCCLCGWGLG